MRIGTVFEFVVSGTPVPKARPRVGTGHGYTSQRVRDYEEAVAWSARAASVPLRSDNDVAVEMIFELPLTKAGAERRVDIDNLAKSILDALNGIAWVDDCQVRTITATKIGAEVGKATIRISDTSGL